MFAFLREDTAERVLVVVNLGGREAAARIDLRKAGVAAEKVTDRIFGAPLPDAGADAYTVTLPAHQGRWLLLK